MHHLFYLYFIITKCTNTYHLLIEMHHFSKEQANVNTISQNDTHFSLQVVHIETTRQSRALFCSLCTSKCTKQKKVTVEHFSNVVNKMWKNEKFLRFWDKPVYYDFPKPCTISLIMHHLGQTRVVRNVDLIAF